jgi:hypothetical protein
VPWSSETGVAHDDLEFITVAVTIADHGSTATDHGSTATSRGRVSHGKHLWDLRAGSGGHVHLRRCIEGHSSLLHL